MKEIVYIHMYSVMHRLYNFCRAIKTENFSVKIYNHHWDISTNFNLYHHHHLHNTIKQTEAMNYVANKLFPHSTVIILNFLFNITELSLIKTLEGPTDGYKIQVVHLLKGLLHNYIVKCPISCPMPSLVAFRMYMHDKYFQKIPFFKPYSYHLLSHVFIKSGKLSCTYCHIL